MTGKKLDLSRAYAALDRVRARQPRIRALRLESRLLAVEAACLRLLLFTAQARRFLRDEYLSNPTAWSDDAES